MSSRSGFAMRSVEAHEAFDTDLYYDGMQVIEERTGVSTVSGAFNSYTGTVYEEFAYSPVYVNAPIMRDKDTNGDGTIDYVGSPCPPNGLISDAEAPSALSGG